MGKKFVLLQTSGRILLQSGGRILLHTSTPPMTLFDPPKKIYRLGDFGEFKGIGLGKHRDDAY